MRNGAHTALLVSLLLVATGGHLEPAGPIGVRLDRQGPPVPSGRR